ncbi:MAG: acyl carrier protein [Syntrophomonadaceae bacterium]|jgi:acyl carrier protein|nr:acyl carrier protein [Syntrophomonadaceae bacterium]
MSVFEELKKIVAEIKDIPEDAITLSSRFEEDLEADSLDVMEMLMILEEKYDILIPEDETENIKTVGEVVEFIEAILKKQS